MNCLVKPIQFGVRGKSATVKQWFFRDNFNLYKVVVRYDDIWTIEINYENSRLDHGELRIVSFTVRSDDNSCFCDCSLEYYEYEEDDAQIYLRREVDYALVVCKEDEVGNGLFRYKFDAYKCDKDQSYRGYTEGASMEEVLDNQPRLKKTTCEYEMHSSFLWTVDDITERVSIASLWITYE